MASGPRGLRDERAKQLLETWKAIVGVQMHFNDIGMRIRAMFVTILLALFASIGFLLDKKLSLQIWIINLQFATLVPLFGILGTMLFYFIDRYWFHRLLKGAVNHAIQIEKKYKAELPELGLSEEIGKESFVAPRGVLWIAAKIFVRHDKFREKGQLHSDGKLEIFYKSVMAVLFMTSVMLACLGGVMFDKPSGVRADSPATPAINTTSPCSNGAAASRLPTNASEGDQRCTATKVLTTDP